MAANESTLSLGIARQSSSQQSLNQNINRRRVENFLVIWLSDTEVSEGADHECISYSRARLHHFVNDMEVFTDPDTCIHYVSNVKDEKVFFIVSEQSAPQLYHWCMSSFRFAIFMRTMVA